MEEGFMKRKTGKKTRKKLRKTAVMLLQGCMFLAAVLTGCGKAEKENVIRIGAAPSPHAEILRAAEEPLKEMGYTLEIIEYNDYILPNRALESGELDANFFQHEPYLENFNAENKAHLTTAAKVHYEPLGIYAGKTKTLTDLPEGAVVAVPNDTTNEARALLLLEAQGLITLKEDAGIHATVLDIADNPKKLVIKEIEAAQIARVLPDVDIACINGNYALLAGLSAEEALAAEKTDSPAAAAYANVIAVRAETKETEKIKALTEAVLSEEIREYIKTQYRGAVVPVF